MRIIKPEVNRLKELVCVIFGHDWSEYGSKTTANGVILEEYNKCHYCGLENHDRSGYLIEHKAEPVQN